MSLLLTDLSYAESIDKKEIQEMHKNAISKVQNLIESKECKKEYNLQTTKQNELKPLNTLVFISFSMPESLIKAYMEEAKRYNSTLVLRGLIKTKEGKYSMPLTISKIQEITQKHKDINIIIHPKLFDMLNVKVVPTIARLKHQEECLLNGSACEEIRDFDKITGSVSINYALETFNIEL